MELVSRCVECGLAEPESLASLGGSAPGVVDGILSEMYELCVTWENGEKVCGAAQGTVWYGEGCSFVLGVVSEISHS